MKNLLMTVISFMSITCMPNIFSSDERASLLGKKALAKKGVFE